MAASQFLNPVSINLQKLPQMPASRFLKYTGRKWPNPVCSFYLPISTSRDDPVVMSRNEDLMEDNRDDAHLSNSRKYQNNACHHITPNMLIIAKLQSTLTNDHLWAKV